MRSLASSSPAPANLRRSLIDLLPAAVAAFIARELVTVLRVAAFGMRSIHAGNPWQILLGIVITAGCALLFSRMWGARPVDTLVFFAVFAVLAMPVDVFDVSRLSSHPGGWLVEDVACAAAGLAVYAWAVTRAQHQRGGPSLP